MKKILLIDLDDTLLDFSKSEYVAVTQTLRSFGLPATDEVAANYKRFNVQVWKEFELGTLSRADLTHKRFDLLLDWLGVKEPNGVLLNEAYCQTLARQHFVMEGAMEFLQKISLYYRVIGISNGTSKVQWQRIKDSGLDKQMERIFVSEDINVRKPTVAFFDYVAAHTPSYRKEDVIVVGDSLSSDIKGGNDYGVPTVWFNPSSATSDLPTYSVSSFEKLFSLLCSFLEK